MGETKSMVELAQQYARRGFGVVRVDPETGIIKEPGGVEDATHDPDEIEERFSSNEYAVAARTSSELFALELDEKAMQEIGFLLNATMTFSNKERTFFIYLGNGKTRLVSGAFRKGCRLYAGGTCLPLPPFNGYEWTTPEDVLGIMDAGPEVYNIISKCIDAGPLFETFEPFTNDEPPQIPFPADSFPPTLSAEIHNISNSLHVPPDMVAPGMLCVLSVCCQRWLRLQIRSDYYEPLILWFLVTAKSGSRKSAALADTTGIIETYIEEYNEAHKGEVVFNADKRDAYEKEISRLKQQVGKEGGKASPEEISEKIRADREKIKEIDETGVQHEEMVINGGTFEAIAEVLARFHECIGLFNSEAEMLQMLGGNLYNGGTVPNIDGILKAFSEERYTDLRKTSKSIQLSRPAATFCLFVQPGATRELLGNRMLNERGLTQRFWFAFPRYQRTTLDGEPLNENTHAAYNSSIRLLLDQRFNHIRDKKPLIIQMSPEAFEILKDFQQKNEDEREQALPQFQSWLSKFVGQTARLAGLLQVYENLQEDPNNLTADVTADTMTRAIEIARYFKAQSAFAFDSYAREDSPEAQGAKRILEKLLKKKDSGEEYPVSRLKADTRSKTYFPEKGDFERSLDILIYRGYVAISGERGASQISRKPFGGNVVLNPEAIEYMSKH